MFKRSLIVSSSGNKLAGAGDGVPAWAPQASEPSKAAVSSCGKRRAWSMGKPHWAQDSQSGLM
jgi:hypothetical protein